MYRLVFLDDGHGSNTPGKRTPTVSELGRSIRENEFNSAVVKLIKPHLTRAGLTPIYVAPTDADTPLKDRTNLANNKYREYQNKYGASKVDAVYVSVHYDAVSSEWHTAEGMTVFVYKNVKGSTATKLAECISDELKKSSHKQKFRGIKAENFHVLRETTMAAVLTENGFMSNKVEARLMLDKAYQKEVAEHHARGICKYFGVKFVEEKSTGTATKTTTTTTTTSNYKISKGDTFTKIAKEYGVSVKEIEALNKGVEPTNLQIGQTIKVPKKKVNNSTTTSNKTSSSSTKKTDSKTINGIKVLGTIKIVNVQNACYITDKPSSNSKNLGTAKLNSTLPIAGSVPNWYEVIYNGKRAYVNTKYAKKI